MERVLKIKINIAFVSYFAISVIEYGNLFFYTFNIEVYKNINKTLLSYFVMLLLGQYLGEQYSISARRPLNEYTETEQKEKHGKTRKGPTTR